MITMQIRQANIVADNQRLDAKRNNRLMALPDMTQAFKQPYAVEPIPRQPLPPVHVHRKMTYEEAYDEASIAACELVGPNAHEYDAVHCRLFDKLCLKHDIE